MTPRWISLTATILLVLMGVGLGLTCMYGAGLDIAARILAGLAAAVCIYALVFLPAAARVRVLMAFFPSTHSALESASVEDPNHKRERE
jgi:hypothetical protein